MAQEIYKDHLPPLEMTSDSTSDASSMEDDESERLQRSADGQKTLVDHLSSRFQVAVQHKESLCVTQRIRASWYSMNQKYTPEQLCKITAAKGPDVFYGLVAQQRRSALAWYEDLLSQIKQRPWRMAPSPISELPDEAVAEVVEEVVQKLIRGDITGVAGARQAVSEQSAVVTRLLQQRAESIAARHSRVIEDQLSDGGWDDAFAEFRADLFTYPNAFMLAPEAIPHVRMSYAKNKPVAEAGMMYRVRTISPFAVFPMPDVTKVNTGEGIFIVDEVSSNTLLAMKGDRENQFAKNIALLLEEHDSGWWAGSLITNHDLIAAESGYFASRSIAGSSEDGQTYSLLRFFGDISDETAFEIGAIPRNEVKGGTIPVQVIMCGGYIVWAAKNMHPLGARPIHTASYETLPRSFWGRGLWDILEDSERQVNKAIRELVVHTSNSLGYFGELDMQRLGKNQIGDTIPLNRIVRTDGDYTRGGHSAFKFHSLESKIPQILALIAHYKQSAEDLTGIRRFMTGATDLGVAGRTNGVVNALQTNSSKLIIMVQGNVNKDVIKPIVQYMFDLNMMFHKDRSIRGDLVVRVEGSDGLAKQERFEQRFESLIQFGLPLMTAQTPSGRPLVDERDIREMLSEYFSQNGRPFEFTFSPNEQASAVQASGTPPGATLGSGGIPQIDGRSNPANLGGISPIPEGTGLGA